MDYENVDGIITHRIKGNIKTHLSVRKMIKQINPDVIIDDMGHAVPWFSTWFTDKKVIVFFRHLHARSLPGQVNFFLAKIITFVEKLYPFIYKNNLFVTESDTSEIDLINLGIKKDNIVRIPPGVDLDFETILNNNSGTYSLILEFINFIAITVINIGIIETV